LKEYAHLQTPKSNPMSAVCYWCSVPSTGVISNPIGTVNLPSGCCYNCHVSDHRECYCPGAPDRLFLVRFAV